MGLGMEWRFEVFYSRWRADELKFEKVGGRGYIYFKRGWSMIFLEDGESFV